MADQIQLPGPITPPQGGPPAPPYELVSQRLSRQQALSQAVPNAINDYIDWHTRQQQLKAGAFKAGGPYLLNALYGNQQPAGPSPAAPAVATPSGDPSAPAQTFQPPQNYSPADNSQMPWMAPQQNMSVDSSQGAQASQALMHPDSGLPQTIHDVEHAGGATDYQTQLKNIQDKMSGYDNMGDYGRDRQQGLATQAQVVNDMASRQQSANQFAENQSREKDQFKTSQDNEESRFERGQGLNESQFNRGHIGGEVSKQADVSQEIRNLQTLTNNLKTSLGTDIGIFGNIKGQIYEASGGRKGSASAAQMQNATIPLATNLNTLLSHRFNAGEVAALSRSLIPEPKDTPAYQQQKLQNLTNLLNVMASGNQKNLDNVASAIMGRGVPEVSPTTSPSTSSPTSNSNSNVPTVTSEQQYQSLPNGSQYMWKGHLHVKGNSNG
jgi:hypothetical protein